MSQAGVSPQAHLTIMVPVVALGTVLLLGRFDPAPHRTGSNVDAPPHFARPTLAIMVLVAVTLSAMVLEGAGADWSAIYMRDVFNAPPFITGFAVALGALTQAITRFFADSFVERYRPLAVARVLLSIPGIGVTVFFAPADWVALVGSVSWAWAPAPSFRLPVSRGTAY
jgi:hypothetical protein